MAELKTKKNQASVKQFISGIEDDKQRRDCRTILKIMQEITGQKPAMWGDSIVGFGSYHYKYPSGREGDWFLTGFSPRKQATTLYVMMGFGDQALMKKLGKYKTGKSCLYIKTLDDVDLPTLKQLIKQSVDQLAEGKPA